MKWEGAEQRDSAPNSVSATDRGLIRSESSFSLQCNAKPVRFGLDVNQDFVKRLNSARKRVPVPRHNCASRKLRSTTVTNDGLPEKPDHLLPPSHQSNLLPRYVHVRSRQSACSRTATNVGNPGEVFAERINRCGQDGIFVRHNRLPGSGSLGARLIQREIFRSEMSNPSISSSPWMRGAPQVGFSATMRKTNSSRSFGVGLRPTGPRTREITLQYMRKPARCQRTTVSGVTMMTACFHRDHSRLMATQKNLSNRLRAGRGRRRFSTVNCCRSKKFSKMRFWRLRKIRRSDPSASHSTLSIIGVITEFWQRPPAMLLVSKSARAVASHRTCKLASDLTEP